MLCRLQCHQAVVKANCPLLLPIPSARSRSKYHEQRIARPRPTLGCQGLVTRLPRRWVGFGRGFLEHLRLSKGRSKAVAPNLSRHSGPAQGISPGQGDRAGLVSGLAQFFNSTALFHLAFAGLGLSRMSAGHTNSSGAFGDQRMMKCKTPIGRCSLARREDRSHLPPVALIPSGGSPLWQTISKSITGSLNT